MKKVFLITVVALLSAVLGFAQESEIRVPGGYQGFFEEGNLFHFDGESSVNLSTTHGFYFGGKTFVGVGFGAEFNNDYILVPFYTAVKYIACNKKSVSPVFHVRLGSYLGHGQGAYADGAVGVRFATAKDFALSILVGATYYDKFEGDDYWVPETSSYVSEGDIDFSGLSVRFGIEW